MGNGLETESAALANGELKAGIMSIHLVAAKVHGIAAAHLPVVVEAPCGFGEEAHTVVSACERLGIGAPATLIGGKNTI